MSTFKKKIRNKKSDKSHHCVVLVWFIFWYQISTNIQSMENETSVTYIDLVKKNMFKYSTDYRNNIFRNLIQHKKIRKWIDYNIENYKFTSYGNTFLSVTSFVFVSFKNNIS
jgi:hypothetical protein